MNALEIKGYFFKGKMNILTENQVNRLSMRVGGEGR